MSKEKSTIIYTLTDEAPYLATAAFLPIIRTFTAPANIDVVESDISVAARILAEFPDCLTDEQKVPNNLSALGKLTLLPDTNIIKLPNISAALGQLTAAIKCNLRVTRSLISLKIHRHQKRNPFVRVIQSVWAAQ